MSESTEGAASVYAGIPGGSNLLEWFGGVPSFHDAEIVELSLHRRALSILRIYTWVMRDEIDAKGLYVLDKHVVVIFTLGSIIDLQLDGFSHQNVIFELMLRRAPDRPDRRIYYSRHASPEDFELELVPCFGMSGRIRFQSVQIGLVPGKPNDVSS